MQDQDNFRDERFTPAKIAVLHHNDADGFGAAFAVWYAAYVNCPPDQERPEIKLIPVQYSEAPPYEELAAFNPDDVVIVDFSYKRDILEGLKGLYPTLTVFDHHKSAKADLEGLDFCFFTEEEASCTQVWKAFNGDLPVPAILGYVGDRDMWKFELPDSKAVNAFIATLPFDLMEWLQFNLHDALLAGKAILAFQERQIKSRLKAVSFVALAMTPTGGRNTAFTFIPVDADYKGFKHPIVNASENISELGEAMCLEYPDAPFSISYCDRAGGKRSFSLRSRNGFDVSEVAKAFGGGGHAGAAGFTLGAPEVF